MNLMLTLGNQLFAPAILRERLPQEEAFTVFMREDRELCTHFRYHKQKIVFFLAAMRTYRDELRDESITVHYEKLGEGARIYDEALAAYIEAKKVTHVFCFEIEDKFFEKRILGLLGRLGIKLTVWPSPMFLSSRLDFASYLGRTKRPFMKVFYEQQRRRLNILVDRRGEPTGGKWSFDTENRLPLPVTHLPPGIAAAKASANVSAVKALVTREFADHPGDTQDFWLRVDRAGALAHLAKFLSERFANFGPFEDAIPRHSDFVYHSVLTPFLNAGLLTPSDVISRALDFADGHPVPLPSLEGFVRQIIGWREFVRGIYQNFSEKQDTANFFGHRRQLTAHWYDASTGIAPLDHAIAKVRKFAYSHHIERLMVVGSLMLLLEIAPAEAHRWFMEMYIDSSDWVMGPNVYGMALFSDGGIFATKPYICGSNYYRKMGGYKATESWCDGVDGLYWGFIEKHRDFFSRNPRLSMMVRSAAKLDPVKKRRIYAAAEALRQNVSA